MGNGKVKHLFHWISHLGTGCYSEHIDNTYSITVNLYTSHGVLSLQAPFTPFLTELMYQNLRQLLTAEQTTSIHYLMIPQSK